LHADAVGADDALMAFSASRTILRHLQITRYRRSQGEDWKN
jgi:hypothetical protein